MALCRYHIAISLIVFSAFLLATVRAQQLVSVNDPNWYFTEHNWMKNQTSGPGASARSNNPGAYFKVGFTGTSCWLWIQTPIATFPYMNLLYSVDGAPYEKILLPNVTMIPLATGLQSGTHYVTLFIFNAITWVDRWYTPEMAVTVLGLYIDNNAKTIPPTLRPKRMLAYWDSIGEGVRVHSITGGDIIDNDSTVTSLMAVAAALQAELSVVAFGGQGYLSTGLGNVAPLFTVGNDSNSAWNKFDQTHSRLDRAGLLSPNPDYIFCGHGTNDMWKPDANVTLAAYGWLVAMRSASPRSWIFLTVDYGGFKRQAITDAYTTYKAKYPKDSATVLLDLGLPAQEGLADFHPTAYGTDGLHPTASRDGQLGAMLAVAAVNAMMQNNVPAQDAPTVWDILWNLL